MFGMFGIICLICIGNGTNHVGTGGEKANAQKTECRKVESRFPDPVCAPHPPSGQDLGGNPRGHSTSVDLFPPPPFHSQGQLAALQASLEEERRRREEEAARREAAAADQRPAAPLGLERLRSPQSKWLESFKISDYKMSGIFFVVSC